MTGYCIYIEKANFRQQNITKMRAWNPILAYVTADVLRYFYTAICTFKEEKRDLDVELKVSPYVRNQGRVVQAG